MYEIDGEIIVKIQRWHSPKRNRFWEKVQKTEGCWIWTGAKNCGGYGMYGKISAHRRSIQLAKRELPPRWHVHHECGNKLCVRPDHLLVVSPQEHRTLHAGEREPPTICVHGHDLTGHFLRITRTGHRVCRECDRLRKKRSRRRTLTTSSLG